MVIDDNFVPCFRLIDRFEIARFFQLKIGLIGNAQHHSVTMKKISVYTSPCLQFKILYE